MTEGEQEDIKKLSIKLAMLFEELKNEFYKTNYSIQNPESTKTDPLTVLNRFYMKLNEFEKGLLELRERLRKYSSNENQ